MKSKAKSIIFSALAAIPLALGGADAEEGRTLDAVMAELAAGGNVILMRHANSPSDQIASVGMTEGCELGAGRGLDAKGFSRRASSANSKRASIIWAS